MFATGTITYAPSDGFYSAAAQIIPVFMLALAIESRLYPAQVGKYLTAAAVRDVKNQQEHLGQRLRRWRLPSRLIVPSLRSQRLFVMTLAGLPLLTVAGFGAALWVLAVGHDNSVAYWLTVAGVTCGAILTTLPLVGSAWTTATTALEGLKEDHEKDNV